MNDRVGDVIGDFPYRSGEGAGRVEADAPRDHADRGEECGEAPGPCRCRAQHAVSQLNVSQLKVSQLEPECSVSR